MGTHEASHRFEEHTGEVRLVLVAPSCRELFLEAAGALAELMLGEGQPGRATAEVCGPQRVVDVTARDRPALLVAWLNELIFLSEVHGQVFTQLHIDRLEEGHMSARVAGVPLTPTTTVVKTAVKAATLHGICVTHDDDVWRAAVVLDV